MGTRARFRVVLHTERARAFSTQAFDHSVVEIHMRRLGDPFERRGSHGVVVVLRRHLDPAGLDMTNRMVTAVVAERKFVCLCTERGGEKLVAEADAENRDLAQEV
jgi:hypothetical protein